MIATTKTGLPGEDVPYWNVNIPKEHWTEECPDFLVGLDAFDTAQCATKDEDYPRMSWEEVQEIIRSNRLELFKRVPSDLRRYRAFLAKNKKSHGSVMNYILKERVKWDELKPKGTEPFQCPEDIKILYNDWPYGLDTAIVHLVVWVKFPFEEDPTTGDLTPRSRKQIADYVDATFLVGADREHIAWFKNWAALKSVQAVEHFHVMLYNPNPELLYRLTNGDQPMAAMLSNEELYGW